MTLHHFTSPRLLSRLPFLPVCCLNCNIRSGRFPKSYRNPKPTVTHNGLAVSAQSLVQILPRHMQPYLKIMRVDKPIGTWLLYWPCTWSIGLATSAGCLPDAYLLGLFGAGAFFMRGAGCIINDLWDRDYDKMVERTKHRPLVTGDLSSLQALTLLSGVLSVSLAILLQLNWYSVFVGAASMGLVVSYPLAKRYTYWPQIVLGLTFNWGALLGWTAVYGEFYWPAVLPLYAAGINWTLVYDTIYAHQDKTDDLIIGVKSTALKFGNGTRYWLTGFASAMVGCLATTGYMCEQTWPFYAALSATAGQLAWQIWTVNINNSADCWSKFSTNTWLGFVLFSGIVAGTYLKKKNEKFECPEDEIECA